MSSPNVIQAVHSTGSVSSYVPLTLPTPPGVGNIIYVMLALTPGKTVYGGSFTFLTGPYSSSFANLSVSFGAAEVGLFSRVVQPGDTGSFPSIVSTNGAYELWAFELEGATSSYVLLFTTTNGVFSQQIFYPFPTFTAGENLLSLQWGGNSANLTGPLNGSTYNYGGTGPGLTALFYPVTPVSGPPPPPPPPTYETIGNGEFALGAIGNGGVVSVSGAIGSEAFPSGAIGCGEYVA